MTSGVQFEQHGWDKDDEGEWTAFAELEALQIRSSSNGLKGRAGWHWSRQQMGAFPFNMNLTLLAGSSQGRLPPAESFRFQIGRDQNLLQLRSHLHEKPGRMGLGPAARQFFQHSLTLSRPKSWQLAPTVGVAPFFIWDGAALSRGTFSPTDQGWQQDLGFGLDLILWGLPLLFILGGVQLTGREWILWIGLPLHRGLRGHN